MPITLYSFDAACAPSTVVISSYKSLNHVNTTHPNSKRGTKDRGRDHSRRQEISIVLAGNLPRKVLRRKPELVPLGALGRKLVRALGEQLEGVRLVDALALGRGDAVADPLPDLGAGDLGGRGVLPVSC